MTREGAPKGAHAVAGQSNRVHRSAPAPSDQFTTHRVSYATAGRAFRVTIARANRVRPRLGALERAVLDAVLELTTSYSKLADSTTARDVARIAHGCDRVEDVDGRDRERVRDALNRLARRDIGIAITPYGRGRSARIVVSVSVERPHTSGGDGDVETPPADWGDDERTPPVVGKNTPSRWQETPPLSAAHREDLEVFREVDPLAEVLWIGLKSVNDKARLGECVMIVEEARSSGLPDSSIEEEIGYALKCGAMWPSVVRSSLRRALDDEVDRMARSTSYESTHDHAVAV